MVIRSVIGYWWTTVAPGAHSFFGKDQFLSYFRSVRSVVQWDLPIYLHGRVKNLGEQ